MIGIVCAQVAARIEQRQVRRCLSTLTELQRESILLGYFKGYTYPETASVLGIPLGMIAALRHNTFVDYAAMFFSNVFHAVPSFLIATLLIFLSVWFGGEIYGTPSLPRTVAILPFLTGAFGLLLGAHTGRMVGAGSGVGEGADDPQEVSEVVFEALTANPPQTRYLVGQAARDVAGLLSLSDEDRDQAFLQMWQGATT